MTSAPIIQNVPVILRRGTVGRVGIEFLDDAGNPADVASLRLSVSAHGGDTPDYEEDFFQVLVPPWEHRIVKPSGTLGRYYIDWGDLLTPAVLNGVAGAYPTGFSGGETLRLQVDNDILVTTFQAGDQSLDQVVARVNATWGPKIGQYVASNPGTGQIRFTSKEKGRRGLLWVLSPGTSPAVLAALGLVIGPQVMGGERINESAGVDSWLFEWVATDGVHASEESRILQTVHVVPGALLQMLPKLRLEIDKAVKLVDQKCACFLGYTDAQLIEYLLSGMQSINGYQPSIFFTPDNYPYQQFGSILVMAGMMWGVMSQQMFAIDTDIPNFSDQGQSFVINHQQPLASHFQQISSWLDREIPKFKLHFVRSGTSLTEMGPNYRLNAVMQAAPSGATFRNLFFRSLGDRGAGTVRWADAHPCP